MKLRLWLYYASRSEVAKTLIALVLFLGVYLSAWIYKRDEEALRQSRDAKAVKKAPPSIHALLSE